MKHQTCDRCERLQRFEFSVKDELWEAAGCKPEEVLCIECFCRLLDDSPNKPRDIHLHDFVFVGIVGTNVAYTILNRVPAGECEFCGDPATKAEFFDREVLLCDQCSAESK